MTKRFVAAGFVVVAMVGCGTGDNHPSEQAEEQVQQGAGQVQQAAEGMAESGAQMTQGLQQMARGVAGMAATGEVVDYHVLQKLMPTVGGWTQAGVSGEQTSAPFKVSRAEARYSRGNASVELEVIDAALNPMFLAPMSMFLAADFSERTHEGFKRSARIADNPAIEEWNGLSKRGEVTVVVKNRFVVQATGHDVADLAAVRGIIDAVDLARLDSLQ